MKKSIQMLMVAMVATVSTTYAQYAGDAIRFSNGNYGSSARFKGMGNAQIGVGGDMSSLGGNPAGLGLFTRSEFSLTPEFNSASSKVNYLGETSKDSYNKLNLNQLGVVWYNPTYRPQGQNTQTGVLSTVFGIGYNRNNDYTLRYNYGGTNKVNSIRNYFSDLANNNMANDGKGTLAANSIEDDAFYGYLINFNAPGSVGKYSAAPFSTNLQTVNEKAWGGTSELDFSGALNISNTVYIGASVGFVNVHYNNESDFRESGVVNPYNNDPTQGAVGYTGTENYTLSFRRSQETKGSGVNARVGVIVRPVDNFRIGATVQTPTWLSIDDYTTDYLSNTLTGGTKGTFNSDNTLKEYPFSYNLRTPLKSSVGASYVIAGQAIISGDVDFIDYSSTHFSDNSGNSDSRQTIYYQNQDIKSNYTSAVNYRFGGEYKISNLSLRAGFGVNGSPVKDDDNKVFETKYYTGGIGYRFDQYYFDLAYQRINTQNTMSSYNLNDGTEPYATTKNGLNNVFLTFGVRF